MAGDLLRRNTELREQTRQPAKLDKLICGNRKDIGYGV